MLAKKSTRGRFFAIVTYRFFNYDQQYTSQYLYYNVGLYVLIYTYHIILWTSSKVHQKANDVHFVDLYLRFDVNKD